MKEIITDFLHTLANCIVVLALLFAGYLLLINLYHYKEISYKYESNLNDNKKYNSFKENVLLSENKLNAVNINNSRYIVANQTKGEISKCITLAKESRLYNLTYTKITSKDIYDLNVEMYDKLSTGCLFLMGYNINRIVEADNSSKTTFKPVYERLEDDKRIVQNTTDYLKNRLLSNSTYSYVTDISRQSIFNESSSNLSLTLDNYLTLTTSINDVVAWYEQEFGGGV
jgi:hypothetical protein